MPDLTRMFVELHFSEAVEDDADEEELMALPPMACSTLGRATGTTKIIGVEYPEPNVVRMELEVADMAIAGIGEPLEGLDEL
jgi:hypothetical protein